MIQRDGASQSLWQHTADEIARSAIKDSTYDVIIAGAGITGITLGLYLQKKGLRCIILESNTVCFGTTGGTTAHINTLLDTPYSDIIKNFGEDNALLVAQAVKEALELIKANIQEHDIQCDFGETSAYLIAQDEEQVKELEEIHEACEKLRVDTKFTNSITAKLPFIKAMEIPSQAKFNPVEYVYALAEAFERLGGVIVQQCRVLNHQAQVDSVTQSDIIEVGTSLERSFYGKSFVSATHIPTGVNVLHFRCAPYRSYAMALKLDEDYPEGLIYDMYDPYHYYRTQEINGEKYFIAGGEDHKTGHEENTEKCFHALEAHVRKFFEVKEVTHKWSSQYYEPADGLPYIGKHPGDTRNVYVATGYGGNGITYSNVATILLADLIMNRNSQYENVFSPNRVKPIAGFSNYIKENADVVKQFISKWFSSEELESLAGLASNEGRVVTYNDRKMALYKDSEGNLHAVNPTCTHLKCSVTWNVVEESWDCPCHGARYNTDGEVLNGPALKDLEQVEVRQLISEQK